MIKKLSNYNYFVSSDGRIFSDKTGKELKPQPSWNGYLKVCFYKDGKRKGFMVHRLVAETFLGQPETFMEVNHKDFNKKNNRVENLEWCTKIENMQHAEAAGKVPHYKGEDNNTSKLTNEDVLVIRSSKKQHKELALDFNVCVRTIVRIKRKESWKHI